MEKRNEEAGRNASNAFKKYEFRFVHRFLFKIIDIVSPSIEVDSSWIQLKQNIEYIKLFVLQKIFFSLIMKIDKH